MYGCECVNEIESLASSDLLVCVCVCVCACVCVVFISVSVRSAEVCPGQ